MSGRVASIWIAAARPKTLPAAAAPVIMGTAIAIREGSGHALAAIAALLGAVLIQVGTNFANDYFDFVKGADTAERIGPLRATQAGLVSPRSMRRAFLLTFGLAIAVGAYLAWRAGWPVVGLGLGSILLGILYTGGPFPLGYRGLADGFVVIFFGPVATAGTHYVQALHLSGAAVVAGLAPGLLATALLTVNNLRDVDNDRKAGKRTLAVRFGPGFAKSEYLVCLLGAAAVPLVLWAAFDGPIAVLLAAAACVAGLPPLKSVLQWRSGRRLSAALGGTGRLLVLYAVAFTLGWLV